MGVGVSSKTSRAPTLRCLFPPGCGLTRPGATTYRVTVPGSIVSRRRRSGAPSTNHLVRFLSARLARCGTDPEPALIRPELMEPDREQADLPAEQPPACQDARLPVADAYPRWSRHPGDSSSQGPPRAVGLSGSPAYHGAAFAQPDAPLVQISLGRARRSARAWADDGRTSPHWPRRALRCAACRFGGRQATWLERDAASGKPSAARAARRPPGGAARRQRHGRAGAAQRRCGDLGRARR
jgi:hypothetical protein